MMTSDQFSRGPGKGVKKLDKKLWGGKLLYVKSGIKNEKLSQDKGCG